jgi:hypothetical protein
MMSYDDIETATRAQLIDELGAAGEPTMESDTDDIDDLRQQVRSLIARYTDVPTDAQLADAILDIADAENRDPVDVLRQGLAESQPARERQCH